MQAYEHRQPLARWIVMMWAATCAIIIALLLTLHDRSASIVLPVVFALVALVTWMFSALTTRVDASSVSWSFAWGWPRGHLPFEHIARVERVKLTIFERGGAGVTWTVWRGWLWSVGGANAVEFHTADGGRITLGTDDPQGLLEAIERFRRRA